MKTYKFEPIHGRARTVALWLIIHILSAIMTIALFAYDLSMLARLDTLTAAEISLWDSTRAISFLQIPINLTTMIIVCFWTYRASANAHSLRKGLETSPPWAVGWYFIPIANLFKPLSTMRDIWQASLRREGLGTPGDNVLGGWWAFWILSGISGNIAFRLNLNADTPEEFVAGAWVGIISAGLGIGSAWLLRTAVLRISKGQAEAQALKVEAKEAEAAEMEPGELAPL
jgi:hypothetical protein